VVLGFVYSLPLTLAIVNKMVLGFWPEWQLNLYWYMLIFGVLVFWVVFDRNTYCDRICPFGAAQECFGAIGWAKARKLKRWRLVLLWGQRILALGCVVIALLVYNPSSTSYEVFSAFFQLIGSDFTFGLLALMIVASFFIKRPWCNYLCPIRPVMDYLKLMRNWAGDVLNRSKTVKNR
jgi:NosR/NirI family nitrous oxide reductase transcriptional regulator